MMKMSELVFSDNTESLWLTILCVALAAIILGSVGGFLYSIFHDGFGKFFAGLLIVIGAISFLLAPLVATGVMHLISEPDPASSDAETLQEWVSENYVLVITDEQADSLLHNRTIYENSNSVPVTDQTLVTYYGEKTLFSLVQSDDEWSLFSNGVAVPRTLTEK